MPDVNDDMIKTDDPARHGVGGNNPPDPIETLRAELRTKYANLVKRSSELLSMEAQLPGAMDDDWARTFTDHIKSCGSFHKHCEDARKAVNEDFRALIRASDGFFKGMSDKVDAHQAKVNTGYLTPYKQKRAAEEQARRDAAAAEAKRVADEQARLKREEEARLAEAKRREAAAEAEARRIEGERVAAERQRAEEARREQERQEAARREAERQAAEATNRAEREAAAAARAKADREAAEAKAASDRAAATAKDVADREAAEARAKVEAAAAERRDQERQAKEAREAAEKARSDKAAADKAASAKAADMSRVRTDLGAVSSLRTTWHHRLIEGQEDKIPRIYLKVYEPSIVAAIRSATTKDGRCELRIPGVEIYSKTESVTR